MEQFEQLLTCAICLDRYRNPKLLPCQHSFCMEPCMDGLVDYVRRQVKCPECRAEHRIPYQGVQGYPTNVTLQRFLELHIEITGELPDPTSGQIMKRCNVCSEKAYCTMCLHCDKEICPECKGAHKDILRREISRITNQVDEINTDITSLENEARTLSTHIRNRDLEAVRASVAFMRMTIEDTEANINTLQADETSDKDVLAALNKRLEPIILRTSGIADSLSIATPPVAAAAPTQTIVIQQEDSGVKLKRPSMPLFSGNIREWPGWWEMFRLSVHDVKMDDMAKYAQLRMAVRGKPRDLVDAHQNEKSQYTEAINDLHDHYADATKLAEAFYEDLKNIKPSTDPLGQRPTLDSVKATLKNLESTGTTLDQDNLKTVITRKFSRETIRWAISRFIKLDDVVETEPIKLEFTIPQLIGALTCAVKLEEWVAHYAAPAETTTLTAGSSKPSPLMALPNLKPPQNQRSVPRTSKCVFCESSSHKTLECGVYGTREKRTQRLDELSLCYVCCSNRHKSKTCPLKDNPCPKCQRPGHQKILCVTYLKERRDNQTSGNNRTGTFVQTFRCIVSSNDRSVEARAVLDSGSTCSYIQTSLVDKLALKNKIKNLTTLSTGTFADSTPKTIESGEVEITISNLEKNRSVTYTLQTTPVVTCTFEAAPPSNLVKLVVPPDLKYADPDIFTNDNPAVELLIGLDLQYEILTGPVVRLLTPKVVMLESICGWIPSGKVESYHPPKSLPKPPALINATNETLNEVVSTEIDKLWSLEVVGIRATELQDTDEKVLTHFQNTHEFINNRYVVRWPWKEKKPKLPTNFKMCMSRLDNLVKNKTPAELLKYDQIFQDQLNDGIIEYAPKYSPEATVIHYLPHRGIEQHDKTRIVFDASAKTKGNPCLNDKIYPGPNLIANSLSLQFNFRDEPIGCTADVEKAFLQVHLNRADRDSVRFLWLKDPLRSVTMSNLLFLRFIGMTFGVTAAPYLLQMCFQHLFSQPPKNRFLQKIMKKFFADNLVMSVESLMEAVEIYYALNERMASAGFNLRGWKSNDIAFLKALNLPTDDLHEDISILGYNWNRANDTISVKFEKVDPPVVITKRIALSILASIFDPCGFFSPLLLPLKLFVQKCWQIKIDWDTCLPPDLLTEFRKMYYNVHDIASLKISRRRWTFPEKGHITLHVFCDSSAKAYACVAYLVYVNTSTGQHASTVIYSKLRIAPINKLSIPKLELLALLIGKRSANFLVQTHNLKFDRIIIWTDATTPLQWLNSTTVLPKFVQNRVNELKSTPNLIYRHVPGQENPADIPTREISFEAFKNSQLWWKGPNWLPYEKSWPDSPENTEIVKTATLVVGTPKPIHILSDQFEKKLSSWDAYIRVIRGFMLLCNPSLRNAIPANSYLLAERKFIHQIQLKYFPEERKQIEAKLQPDRKLNLFLDENGLIRCKGRLGNTSFPYDTINPILLPRNSPLTRLYITKIHSENLHMGCSYTLAKIRERFWIKKGRALVKSILHRCVTCRRVEGGSYQLPPMPDLPNVRVTTDAPFMYTGVDYLGPVYIIDDAGQKVKVYAAIFVCLVTRAIHLEVARDLSADRFLMALERFSNRRGCPKFLISDNATNFVFVQPLVGKTSEISNIKINRYLSNKVITWKFIPQYAPWHGGAYERLVALVKSCLRKCYRINFLVLDEFETALTKIENILNGRPLTYTPDEILVPITPNHLLLPARRANINETVEVNEEELEKLNPNRATLLTSLKNTHAVVENFWSLFCSDYILSLRERHTVNHPTTRNSLPFVPRKGEVVLVKEPRAPRATWKLGVVLSVDKPQRVANVRCNEKTTPRAINQLFPLELPDEKFVDNSKAPISKSENPENKPQSAQQLNLPTKKQPDVLLPTFTPTPSTSNAAPAPPTKTTKKINKRKYKTNTPPPPKKTTKSKNKTNTPPPPPTNKTNKRKRKNNGPVTPGPNRKNRKR